LASPRGFEPLLPP